MIKLTWILILLLKAVTAEEWHNNPDTLKSYFVSQNEMNWDSAQAECRKRHSILAVVLDSEDNDYIDDITRNDYLYWLGLRRAAADCTCTGVSDSECEACRKTFYWANVNEPMDYIEPWKGGRPWDNDNRECGVMDEGRNAQWVDVGCRSERRFVCQYNCSPHRCKRRECRFYGNTYQCECDDGFTGNHCEEDIDECQSTPCKNRASCINEISRYRCDCIPGYTGTNCETDIDECASSPCPASATCNNAINKFTCECACGYTGTICEIDIDECSSNPCGNGGTCRDMICGYKCRCTDEYEGPHCEQLKDPCLSEPCRNGATCTSQGSDYICTCPRAYTGSFCETEINECNSSPCFNDGNCTDGIGFYVCSCHGDFTGMACETDLRRGSDTSSEPQDQSMQHAFYAGCAFLGIAFIGMILIIFVYIKTAPKKSEAPSVRSSTQAGNGNDPAYAVASTSHSRR